MVCTPPRLKVNWILHTLILEFDQRLNNYWIAYACLTCISSLFDTIHCSWYIKRVITELGGTNNTRYFVESNCPSCYWRNIEKTSMKLIYLLLIWAILASGNMWLTLFYLLIGFLFLISVQQKLSHTLNSRYNPL